MPNTHWFELRLDRRAPRGGEVDPLTGKFHAGGEFNAFYVPRAVMPQVDEVHFPELFEFAASRNVDVVSVEFNPPTVLKPHQRVDRIKAKHMTAQPEVLAKPIFVSLDDFILDGNHRWFEHVLLQVPVKAYQFRLDFEDAIKFLFDFPQTYAYGDGDFHPISS